MNFKISLIIAVCLCCFCSCKSQFNPNSAVDKKIINLNDSIFFPLPVNGEVALKEFIKKELIIPEVVYKNKIEGEIYLALEIDTLGSITKTRLIRTIQNCTSCEEEAIRVANLLHSFIPAYQIINGKKKLIKEDYYIKVPFKYN